MASRDSTQCHYRQYKYKAAYENRRAQSYQNTSHPVYLAFAISRPLQSTMSMTLEDAQITRDPKPFPRTSSSVLAQFSMRNKVVAITGAADGIGLAVADAVAEAGADVALWYNTNDLAIKNAQLLEDRYNVRVIAYKVNVSDDMAVEKAVEQTAFDFGKIDVFVANAGMAISKAITEQTIDEYKKQMSVNGRLIESRFVASVY